ncbi:MAG: MATE family efflux transporter [Clostridia bacterium]|nr:MATE family efflux transporter [Clostridia bacterium]
MLKFLKRFFDPSRMVSDDIVRGPIPSVKEAYGRMISLAWPSAVESVLICLTGSVDTMMVGTLGAAAISAVGITSQPRFLMMTPIIALNTGVTAVVARRRGEGDFDGARRTLKQALIFCMIFCILMVTGALFFAEGLLTLAGAQSDFIDLGVEYYRIIMCGQVFACIGMTINAAQRGYGNTKISMRSNIAANIVNLIFNFFLINGIWFFPRLETRGAAIATALGAIVAFFMALSSVLKPDAPGVLTLRSNASWKFDKRTVGSIFKVASSTFVEQIFMRFGFFTYASLVARLGTVEFATHQICMNIINVSFGFSDGFSVASTSLVGQNLGAKRPDLSMMFGKIGQRLSLVAGFAVGLVFVIFRKELILLFNDDPAIVAMGSVIMLIVAITCLAQSTQVVMSGCLRGAGDTRYVAMSSFISIAAIRPAMSWLLCYPLGLGVVGAWLGLFGDQFLRMILNTIRFYSGKWSTIKL